MQDGHDVDTSIGCYLESDRTNDAITHLRVFHSRLTQEEIKGDEKFQLCLITRPLFKESLRC